jgi:hypothetical protein
MRHFEYQPFSLYLSIINLRILLSLKPNGKSGSKELSIKL